MSAEFCTDSKYAMSAEFCTDNKYAKSAEFCTDNKYTTSADFVQITNMQRLQNSATAVNSAN
jgi:hypothetical protein